MPVQFNGKSFLSFLPTKLMQKANRDLTKGKITKNLICLAIPILMTYILQDAFEVVDMIFQEQVMLSERITKLESQTKELKKNQPNTTWTNNNNNRFLPNNIQKQK